VRAKVASSHPTSDKTEAGVGRPPTPTGTFARHADPLVAALARYVEALDRRYPQGPEQLRREGLDGRATITRMSDRPKGTAA
jgi:hypothetical protein